MVAFTPAELQILLGVVKKVFATPAPSAAPSVGGISGGSARGLPDGDGVAGRSRGEGVSEGGGSDDFFEFDDDLVEAVDQEELDSMLMAELERQAMEAGPLARVDSSNASWMLNAMEDAKRYVKHPFTQISSIPPFFYSGTLSDRAIALCGGLRCDLTPVPSVVLSERMSEN
jgi:hypothetical protein